MYIVDVMEPQDTATDTPKTSSVNGGEILINMGAMIKNHITSIDKLSDEAKKFKEMLDDIFANNPVYVEHDKAAKEAAKLKTATKAEILKQPQAADLNNKVRNLRSEIKELKGALSDYLQEYARLSGVNEIEDENGK